MLTLNGQDAIEFWIVDAKTRTVTVHTKTGMSVYRAGFTVPVAILDDRIDVDEIFFRL